MGIDAVAYVAFVRLCLALVLLTLPFDLSVVLWCNVTGGANLSQTTRSDLDPLTMGNVKAGSPRLWAHFGSVVYKTLVCLKLLDRFSARLYQMQLDSIANERALLPEAYSVLVTDIPPGQKIGPLFRTVWGSAFAAYTPVPDPTRLGPLSAKREKLRINLENARWRFENPQEGQARAPLTVWRGLVGLGGGGQAMQAMQEQEGKKSERVVAPCTCAWVASAAVLQQQCSAVHSSAGGA